MVFYFSATGNSLWVARSISKTFNEPLRAVADELHVRPTGDLTYTLRDENEMLFFVFPVHSWGPAILMKHFLSRLCLEGWKGQRVFAICTCGDDCGYTDRIVRNDLAGRGIPLTVFFSIQMPNNYILMRGFGVDSDRVREDKLHRAPDAIKQIVQAIHDGEYSKSRIIRTGMPWLKSYVVYPAFRYFVVGRQSFRTTDACISCGLCARVCPTGTVVMRGNKPEWRGKACVQCTACIHRCPVRAIEYGRVSVGQGRYLHPILSGKES